MLETTEPSSSESAIEFVDLRERGDPGLLRDVYDRLFLPSILLEEERQSFELWTRRFATPAPPPPEPYVTGIAAGVSLDDPSERRLAGYLFFERYRRSRTLLLAYLGVDEAFRRQGIARRMLEFGKIRTIAEAREEAPKLRADADPSPVRATFAEIHIPGGIDAQYEPMETIARVRTFASLGAAVLPIQYIQPALEEGQPFGRSLMLLTFPHPSEAGSPAPLARSVLDEFVIEYYQSCGFSDPSCLPEYRSVSESIAAAAGGRPDFELPEDCRGVIAIARVAEG